MGLSCLSLRFAALNAWASPVAQLVKNLPAIQETSVQSLGQRDLLEKENLPAFLPGKSHGQRRAVMTKSLCLTKSKIFAVLPSIENVG